MYVQNTQKKNDYNIVKVFFRFNFISKIAKYSFRTKVIPRQKLFPYMDHFVRRPSLVRLLFSAFAATPCIH